MTQTLTLTPSSAPLGLDPWFSGSPLVITGTVPTSPTMATWRAQIWASNYALIEDADAEPLATAIGSETGGVLTIGFTPSQISSDALGLSSVVGNNSFWLVLGGQNSNGSQQIIRAGTIEITPCPWSTAGTANVLGITIVDDVASFEYNGATYSFVVAHNPSPAITPDDGVDVGDDTAYFEYEGNVYDTPTAVVDPAPPEAIEGELVVVDDNVIILLSGIAYTIPVVQVS